MEKDREQIIQDYLDNKLADSERNEFEKKMASDVQLATEVEELRNIVVDLQSIGMDVFKGKTDKWEQNFRAEQKRKRNFSLLAVAVCTAVLIISGYYLAIDKPVTPERIYASNYQPYENMIDVRGDDAAGLKMKGMEAYDKKSYATSAEFLEQYLINNKNDYAAMFYLSIVQNELGRYEAAERNFKKVMQEPAYKQQAEWYFALMLLKKGDFENSKQLFKAMANDTAHYRNKKAEEILAQLNSIR